MASYKFNRWDNALKQCMDAKKRGGLEAKKANRWNSDPLLLNEEAHELPPAKQREALDMVDEAPSDLRAKLAPMWKYCFVQWHIYDAGLEAVEQGRPLREGFADELLLKDVDSLGALFASGDLDKAKTAEKWTWKLLEPFAPAGTIEPWTEDSAAPLLQVGKEERREGVLAFAEEHYEKAFFHFWQGLKLVARAPATVAGPHAKLRCDLYKNRAAAALKLKLNRIAIRAADFAIAIDSQDPKAWYRKACALEAMGREAESRAALVKAGLATLDDDLPPQSQGSDLLSIADGGLNGDLPEDGDLPLRWHARLEQMVFIEVGIDSITAIDMMRHIKAELPDMPMPPTMVYDNPNVQQFASALLYRLNTGDDPNFRAKVNSTIWRAMCRALGTDPVQGTIDGRLGHVTWPMLAEQQAEQILSDLLREYETEEFVQKTRSLAKRANFEQRAFLVQLRPAALEVQRPILEAWGFSADAEGVRQLECAVASTVASAAAPELRGLLRRVREAQQGGPNGMWAVNMENTEVEVWADCHSTQVLSTYMKADPFGNNRKNTNSVLSSPMLA